MSGHGFWGGGRRRYVRPSYYCERAHFSLYDDANPAGRTQADSIKFVLLPHCTTSKTGAFGSIYPCAFSQKAYQGCLPGKRLGIIESLQK